MKKIQLGDIIDRAIFVILVAVIVLVPIGFDTRIIEQYIWPKQLLFIVFTFSALLLTVAKVVVNRSIVIYHTALEKFLLVGGALMLLSSIFSGATATSFLGRSDYFVFNALFYIVGGIFVWLVVQTVVSSNLWRFVIDTLTAVGAVTTSLFLGKTLLGATIITRLLGESVWSTVDATNTNFGMWLVVLFLLSAGQLISKNVRPSRLLLHFYVVLSSFLGLIVLGFPLFWWPLVIGIILLFAIGTSFISVSRRGWLVVLFGVMLLSVLFIMFGSPQSLQRAVPQEIALSQNASWVVVSNTIFSNIKYFLLGTGAGTFGVDFSAHRDASFNYSAAANVRFNYPYSSVLSLAAELGVPFLLTLIFVVLYYSGYLFSIIRRARAALYAEVVGTNGFVLEEALGNPLVAFETLLLAVPWAVLTGATAIIFFSTVLWWLWFVMLGLITSGLMLFNPRMVRRREIFFEEKPEQGLSYTFALVIGVSAVVIFTVWYGRLYLADKLYTEAVRTSDVTLAEQKLKNAIAYRENYDQYHAALAQVFLNQAVTESKAAKPDLQLISTKVGAAVTEARRATEISPLSVSLWENLATMYENAAALVPEARGWAVKTLQEAVKLEPSNAYLVLRLGNNYAIDKKWNEAIVQYQIAVDLKKDLMLGYKALATAYEQNKQTDKALATLAAVAPAANNDVELLYNYGRLLYNRNNKGDRDSAEQIWQQVLQIQPTYSNALYSLGLLNELRGNRSAALEYYYKVKNLNPSNKDIDAKIKSLVR